MCRDIRELHLGLVTLEEGKINTDTASLFQGNLVHNNNLYKPCIDIAFPLCVTHHPVISKCPDISDTSDCLTQRSDNESGQAESCVGGWLDKGSRRTITVVRAPTSHVI
ncbi:hypothetical protein J6590_008296 [Homalodisca vitripennis]|nr:hypothetical protein J6590_008296 [Homalodisca vitripennis]